MRRVALFAGAVMLAATAARAQQTLQQFSVPGLPLDVEIADGGGPSQVAWIGVGASDGYAFIQGVPGNMNVTSVPGGGTTAQYVSAYLNPANPPNGCLTLVYLDLSSGVVPMESICGTPRAILASGEALRVRHSASGFAYANVHDGTSGEAWFGQGPVMNPAMWPVIAPGVLDPGTSRVVSAFRDQGTEYGFDITQSGIPYLIWDGGVGGTSAGGYASFPSINISNASDVSLYRDSEGLAALIATDTGLYLTRFQNGGPAVQMTAPVPTSLVGQRVTGVSFHTETGNSSGDGFGMAVATDGGYSMVYGAVPDPGDAGRYWVPRPEITLDGGLPQLQRVTCNGAVLCAFTSDQSTGNNVVVYANRTAPYLIAPVTMVRDDQIGFADADPIAYDADKDPMFLRWSIDAGIPLSLRSLTTRGDELIGVDPAGYQCTGQQIARYWIEYTVSDGYAPYTTPGQFEIDLVHSVLPADPTISPTTYSLIAGSGPRDFTATSGSTGCPARSFLWTAGGAAPAGAAFVSGTDGGTMTVTPPPALCQTATVPYTVKVDDGVLRSPGLSITFTFQPWGAPEAPFPPSASVTTPGDAGAWYSPWATHACADAGTGFPGVTTTWFLDSTSSLVPEEAIANGAPAYSGVTAPDIWLKFPDCSNGTYVLSAQNLLDGADAGPQSSLTIDVVTPMVALESASVSVSATRDGGGVSAELASDLNCAAQRGFEGHFELRRHDGGTLVGSASGPYPWTYSVPLAMGCAGGQLDAIGWISDGAGTMSTDAGMMLLDLPQLEAGATLTGSSLTAQCGAGASGTVTATFPAGTCPTSGVSWSQDDGPPLEPVPNGPSATFRTVEGGLDGLIGSWVHVRATLDGGPGNMAEVVHPLQIVPDPLFVRLVHDTDAPVADEAGILGVRVRITNETDCPVTRVTLHEQANGLRYVPGTARLDGVPLEPGAVDPELRFDGLSLAAHQTRTLTYSGRPAMLGKVDPQGWASMNGVAVSDTRGITIPPPRCGCGQSPGGAMAFAAVLLAWAARRRLRARS